MVLLISSDGLGYIERFTLIFCDISLIAVSDLGSAPNQPGPLS